MANIQIAEHFREIDFLDTEISYREKVVEEKKELLHLMVGQLYPPMVREQIWNLNNEIDTLKKRRAEIEMICELNKEYLLKKWNLQ